MARATIVVHGDLADHLSSRALGRVMASVPEGDRVPMIQRTIAGHPGVKDVIEAVGIPHPEIAAIAVNGEPAGFDRRIADGDRIEVWPADLAARDGRAPVMALSPEDATEPRFVLDGHLGRLAAYLRMLGFDTRYRTDAEDDELAEVAASEGRILLTRDRALLRRGIVRRGAFLRSDQPVEQLVETVRRFGLSTCWQPFGRCLRCNTPLSVVSPEEILPRLEPLTRIHYREFRRCPGCDAIYWKGSHHARMARLIERVRADAQGEARDADAH